MRARSVWLQPKMYGVSLEARDILVFPEDDSDPFPSDEEDDE